MQKLLIQGDSAQKKKLILILVWGITLLAWLSLVGVGFMKPTIEIWVTGVTFVVVLTEVAFWTTALIWGVSLWDSRKKAYSFLFRRK